MECNSVVTFSFYHHSENFQSSVLYYKKLLTKCITKSIIFYVGGIVALKKMGRPKGENNKEKICTIRMDESTLSRLEAYCNLMKVAKSEAIRGAINKMIEDVPNTNNMKGT